MPSTATTASTRSGRCAVTSSAMAPPKLWPTRIADVIPRAAQSAAMSSATTDTELILVVRYGAVAVTRKIDADHSVGRPQRVEDRPHRCASCRPAVQQHDRRPIAGARVVVGETGYAEPEPRQKIARSVRRVGHSATATTGTAVDDRRPGASAGNVELQQLRATIERERLAGAERIVTQLDGFLRDDLGVQQARDQVWTLISPEVRRLLVDGRGWSIEEYETWVSGVLMGMVRP